jgi:hypothetical protein
MGGDVPVDSEALLVTDFVNLKIKLGQSFGCAHKGKVCVCHRMCISICVYTIFLKKRGEYLGATYVIYFIIS